MDEFKKIKEERDKFKSDVSLYESKVKEYDYVDQVLQNIIDS